MIGEVQYKVHVPITVCNGGCDLLTYIGPSPQYWILKQNITNFNPFTCIALNQKGPGVGPTCGQPFCAYCRISIIYKAVLPIKNKGKNDG